MRIILIAFLVVAFTAKVFGTAQAPDRLIYKGKEYSLHTNPLEEYFDKNPDKRPKSDVISTGLWRGYIATFEIRGGALYLKNIVVKRKKIIGYGYKSVLDEVFPKQKDIKIDWLSGLLVLPYGEIVDYVHMGYGSTYENYILLEINKGNLKREKNFNNKEYSDYKEKQFNAYKKTDEYKTKYEELKVKGWKDDMIDNFIKSYENSYREKLLDD